MEILVRGFLSLVFLIISCYLVIGLYVLLPYWLVSGAMESLGSIITLLYSLGVAVWIVVVYVSIVAMGSVRR